MVVIFMGNAMFRTSSFSSIFPSFFLDSSFILTQVLYFHSSTRPASRQRRMASSNLIFLKNYNVGNCENNIFIYLGLHGLKEWNPQPGKLGMKTACGDLKCVF